MKSLTKSQLFMKWLSYFICATIVLVSCNRSANGKMESDSTEGTSIASMLPDDDLDSTLNTSVERQYRKFRSSEEMSDYLDSVREQFNKNSYKNIALSDVNTSVEIYRIAKSKDTLLIGSSDKFIFFPFGNRHTLDEFLPRFEKCKIRRKKTPMVAVNTIEDTLTHTIRQDTVMLDTISGIAEISTDRDRILVDCNTLFNEIDFARRTDYNVYIVCGEIYSEQMAMNRNIHVGISYHDFIEKMGLPDIQIPFRVLTMEYYLVGTCIDFIFENNRLQSIKMRSDYIFSSFDEYSNC